jgi:outer membrane cobalamin receptor
MRTGFTLALLVVLLLPAACIGVLHAQEGQHPVSPPAAHADSARSARQDTAHHVTPDSALAVVPDSLVHYQVPLKPGSLDQRLAPRDVITDTAMDWTSARTLNQVVAAYPGIFGSEPSGVGQYFPLTIRGAGLRSYNILVDGRPAEDPASGIYNLSMFPMEMAERIEIVTGPRSFLYGTAGAGGTLNIVTHTPSHRVPFTKIRYEEAGYEHAYSDGSYNQNLTRRINLGLGYQYITTGARYYNSAHEQWNIRGALRYHILPDLSVTLSEHYVQTETQLYGGIDYASTGYAYSFEPKLAAVYSTAAYEKLTRHDIDLRFVGMFLPDSTALSTLTFYYSGNLREFRDEESDGSATVHDDHRSSWFGVRAQQSASLGVHHFTAGFSLDMRHVEASPAIGARKNASIAAWAMDDIQFTDDLGVAVYGRSEVFRGEHLAGFGADASLPIGSGFTLRGGASVSRRAPTYPELYWSDSTLVRDGVITTEKHQHVEAGLQWNSPDFGMIRLVLAHRVISNPILTAPYAGSGPFPGVRVYNGGTIRSLSAELAVDLRLFRYILVEGSGTYLLRRDASGVRMDDCPEFWGEGGAYLAGKFLNDHLDLKAGARGRITTRYYGYLFSPQALFPVPNTIAPLGMGSTLDLLAVAHIGSAYVHIMWENVTDTRYFTSPFTPVLARTVRFGISWEFFN